MTILTAVALLPPLILMVMVYKTDNVEREPVGLIIKTLILGALSAIPTIIVEMVAGSILGSFFYESSLIYMLLENFIGVALIEEFFKMQACKLSVWKNKEFNYTFDGVVYCVASAIGFAALENVLYVFQGGLGTGIMRAITAIPGHTIFGIFMGVNLGVAKYLQIHGDMAGAKRYKRLALLIPTLIHGTYDFLCTVNSGIATIAFFVGLIILDIVAIKTVKKNQRGDTAIFEQPEEVVEVEEVE